MVYDPQSWDLLGVYDDLGKALRIHFRQSVEQYEEHVRLGDFYYKDFYPDLSVWDVLRKLRETIGDTFDRTHETVEEQIKDQRDFALCQIDESLQPYHDYVQNLGTYHTN